MSTTDQIVERGRMIAALRRQKRYKNVRVSRQAYGYYRKQLDKRWFTDTEIQSALSITKTQFNAALKAYQGNRRAPGFWNREKIIEAVLNFCKRHNRWPTYADNRKRCIKENLPSDKTYGWHFFNRRYDGVNMGGFHACQAEIVHNDKLFKKLTPSLILTIPNVTVRRTAMEKYGIERLLKKGGGVEVQHDDYGKLWRLPSDNRTDKWAQWIEVVNATPEPNGRYAHYFLRVPPTCNTAREGVAWTFGSEDTLEIRVAT